MRWTSSAHNTQLNAQPKASLRLVRASASEGFIRRAMRQPLVHFITTKDGAGQTLDSAKNYTIRFAPGQLPKVNAFWSLTMYDQTFNFTENALNRYSIGDRTEGLKKDADGGLTIYIQRASPGKDKESNWLPSTRAALSF